VSGALTLFQVEPLDFSGDWDRRDNQSTGALGETKAVAELLQRGYKVARPVVDDDGVDLIVSYRITVQVKTARRWTSRGWNFQCFQRARRAALPSHIDILLCHALDVGAWWMIPAPVARDRDQETLAIRTGSPLDVWRGRWDLFDRGACP